MEMSDIFLGLVTLVVLMLGWFLNRLADTVAALTAGTNVAIAANGTVSSTDTTYSVGDNGLTQKNFTSTLKSKLDGIATSANNYSLSTASSTVLGGVKIGSGLSISSGTVSVSNMDWGSIA